jgi:YgiT-type zinc finger domain-containing protein
MRCVICRQGEVRPGTATVTMERGGVTLVVKGVRARVCEDCGEEYFDEDVTGQLLRALEAAVEAGSHAEESEAKRDEQDSSHRVLSASRQSGTGSDVV